MWEKEEEKTLNEIWTVVWKWKNPTQSTFIISSYELCFIQVYKYTSSLCCSSIVLLLCTLVFKFLLILVFLFFVIIQNKLDYLWVHILHLHTISSTDRCRRRRLSCRFSWSSATTFESLLILLNTKFWNNYPQVHFIGICINSPQ